jgi:hypothetical protein
MGVQDHFVNVHGCQMLSLPCEKKRSWKIALPDSTSPPCAKHRFDRTKEARPDVDH